jgi:hypothetical protein
MDLSDHAPSRTRRRAARSLVVSATAVVLAAMLTTGTPSTPASADAAAAITHATSPGAGVPGAVAVDEPAGADDVVRDGPDPTGREIPPRSQRIIDSAVWLWLLACTALAVAAVTRTWWRRPSGRDADPENPEHPESDAAAPR